VIWRTGNVLCFDNKRIKSPTKIVCMICSIIIFWAGLLKEDLEKQVIQGVEAVKTIALFFHNKDLEMQSQDDHQLVPYVG